MLLPALAFALACSTVPGRDWPALQLGAVMAQYTVADGGEIEVPVSSVDLTILSLVVEPPQQQERWRDGRRFLVPPPGCTSVVVRCHYRAYAHDGALPSPQQLFPGAVVTPLQP